ncbi:Hypothetical predicted protein [Paramuricea clavata]|uniref:Uncharacterized protein n=1 Tax=Paramuricea clavata TaxID=317549 RepID=A0A6S7INU3_PARCT|nr:Hypothetical predicted protein [Paramuricea clavata]
MHEKQSNDIEWEKLPEERKKRSKWISVVVCILTTTAITAQGFTKRPAFKYKTVNVNDISTTQSEATKNGTIIIHKREKKDTLPILLNLGTGLVAIMVSTVFHHFCLISEEPFHVEVLYLKNHFMSNVVTTETDKMLKARFDGISHPAIGVLFLVLVMSSTIPLIQTVKHNISIYLMTLLESKKISGKHFKLKTNIMQE